jgi:hypothetical protein
MYVRAATISPVWFRHLSDESDRALVRRGHGRIVREQKLQHVVAPLMAADHAWREEEPPQRHTSGKLSLRAIMSIDYIPPREITPPAARLPRATMRVIAFTKA